MEGFLVPNDIWPLPFLVRQTAPFWLPVSREEPTGKHLGTSRPSWETRPPSRWEGRDFCVQVWKLSTNGYQSKVSLFPTGEPSFPGPHEAFPLRLPKVQFLILEISQSALGRWDLIQICCCSWLELGTIVFALHWRLQMAPHVPSEVLLLYSCTRLSQSHDWGAVEIRIILDLLDCSVCCRNLEPHQENIWTINVLAVSLNVVMMPSVLIYI